MPVKVLFINNVPETCGVNQYGQRTHKLLLRSEKLQVTYAPCDSMAQAMERINATAPDVVLYNFHSYTIPWANNDLLAQYPHIKHIAIVHEPGMVTGSKMNQRIQQDTLPRILFECTDNYVEHPIPVIGSFGFGSWHKGFHNLILRIQEQFDEAVFRLHIPPSHYCDPNADLAKAIVAECQKRITKPGIKIDADYEFFSEEQLLTWLNQNTLNAFHYEPLPYSPGNSSVIDYALSAKRPIAITKSPMFRQIEGAVPSVFIEDVPMKQTIANGLTPLAPFYEKWSIQNAINYWEGVLC